MVSSNLSRLLWPQTVAVVGASEKLGMSNNAVLPMLEAGVDVRLVNPNRTSVYDRSTTPTLSSLDEPVDAVLSLVNAERSIGVVEEAASTGCGGVVVAAGGFAELGGAGRVLQDRLIAAAGSEVAVVGPNCSGLISVAGRRNLFTGGRITLQPGPVAVVSQSGFLLRSVLAGGVERQLRFSVAISSGNEAVCDLADYLDALGDDPATQVVCLVVEKVRHAERFLAAVERVRAAGKAVLALKLGRSEQSRQIIRSHTGAIADDSWVYEVVLESAGVLTARDVDDMLDRVQLLAQLPPQRWCPVRGVAVVTSSGGVAAVAADAAAEQGATLPPLVTLEPWVRQTIPGEGGLNPLDMTGFVMRDPALLKELFARYASSGEADALILCWWAGAGDEEWSRLLLGPFAEVSAASPIPLVVTPVESTAVGGWTEALRDKGVSFCRGLTSTYRALDAVDRVARWSPAPTVAPGGAEPGAEVRPASVVDRGGLVGFAEAMAILTEVGIAVAPWVLLEPGDDAHPGIAALGDGLVVKLADVAHRSDLDAVRLGVAADHVAATATELRHIARSSGHPATVVVQGLAPGHGEAFIGLQAHSDLGPILLFGVGGVAVELTRRVGGRRLPLAPGAAASLVEEIAGPATTFALRGGQGWPQGPLVAAVEGVAELWRRHGSWLASADLNPVMVGEKGVVAVDALLVADVPSV